MTCKPRIFLAGARSATGFNHIYSSFGTTIIVTLCKQYRHSRSTLQERLRERLWIPYIFMVSQQYRLHSSDSEQSVHVQNMYYKIWSGRAYHCSGADVGFLLLLAPVAFLSGKYWLKLLFLTTLFVFKKKKKKIGPCGVMWLERKLRQQILICMYLILTHW